MRIGALAVTGAVVATLVTATGLAAVVVKDPKSLALRASDLPSNASLVNENVGKTVPLPSGGKGKAYLAGFSFRSGARDEEVVTTVIATGSKSQASSLFAALKKEALSKTKADKTRLPRYGDQQLLATFYDGRGPNVWSEELVVQKNTVVWHLQVGAHPSSSKPFPKAQALAELQKYARKQKARVGNG